MVSPYSREEVTQGSNNYTFIRISDAANYTDGGKLLVEGTGKFAFATAPYLESLTSTAVLGTNANGQIVAATNVNAQSVTITARNNTGSAISKGAAVRISGALGQNPTIALARADQYSTTDAIGLAAATINNNSTGSVIIAGTLTDLDTQAFTDGATLYLSPTTPGALTATEPTKPNWQMQIGYVEHAHPTQGKILVHPNLESTKVEYISDMTASGEEFATFPDITEGNLIGRGSAGGNGGPQQIVPGYGFLFTGLGDTLSLALSNLNDTLTGNVVMTTAGTWYSGPTITLTAGTWLVTGCISVEKGAFTGTNSMAVRISTGSTHYVSGEHAWNTRAGAVTSINLSTIITVASNTQIWMQAVSSYNGGNILRATVYSASGNTASQISAVRIA